MKVLLLSRYDRLCASSRLRTMQYLPMLADAGIQCPTRVFGKPHRNWRSGPGIYAPSWQPGPGRGAGPISC